VKKVAPSDHFEVAMVNRSSAGEERVSHTWVHPINLDRLIRNIAAGDYVELRIRPPATEDHV